MWGRRADIGEASLPVPATILVHGKPRVGLLLHADNRLGVGHAKSMGNAVAMEHFDFNFVRMLVQTTLLTLKGFMFHGTFYNSTPLVPFFFFVKRKKKCKKGSAISKKLSALTHSSCALFNERGNTMAHCGQACRPRIAAADF